MVECSIGVRDFLGNSGDGGIIHRAWRVSLSDFDVIDQQLTTDQPPTRQIIRTRNKDKAVNTFLA